MQKILFVCNDFIGSAMAGPGIRSWEMAHALERKGHRVALLSRHLEKGFSGNVTFLGKASFSNLIRWILRSDYVVQTGRPMSILLTYLFQKKTIFDQYDPVIFEFLEQKPVGWAEKFRLSVMLFLWRTRQRFILKCGRQFLVANEKQKDFLIGQLSILGYSNKFDSVTVLPFGLSDRKPTKTQPVLRGTKIKDSDFLLVWGGGVWGWFDPLTLLQTLVKIKELRDDIKVYFPGIKPPSPDSQKLTTVSRFIEEVKSLGLNDSTVFLNLGWTAYEQRADYLLEADAGISLHHDCIETRFSFRTRILDYLWAGLPIIATKGDSWADDIEKRGLGLTIAPEDIHGLASAILTMADDSTMKKRCQEHVRLIAAEYVWDNLVDRISLSDTA